MPLPYPPRVSTGQWRSVPAPAPAARRPPRSKIAVSGAGRQLRCAIAPRTAIMAPAVARSIRVYIVRTMTA